MRDKRRKIWIDGFQTRLSIRIALYFVCYQVIFTLLFSIGRGMIVDFLQLVGMEAIGFFILVSVVTLVSIGGLFIYDALLYTHRIVGPLYRFRKTIQAITAGDEVELLRLREGDQLQEMKDDLNEMLRALHQRGAIELKAPEDADRLASPAR